MSKYNSVPVVPVVPVVWINGETLRQLAQDPKRRLQRVWINPKRTEEDDTPLYTAPQASAMTDTAATMVRTIRVQQVTIATLEAALKESRANDLQGMQWLSEVVEAAGLRDVDMPTLIDHVRALRAGTI